MQNVGILVYAGTKHATFLQQCATSLYYSTPLYQERNLFVSLFCSVITHLWMWYFRSG